MSSGWSWFIIILTLANIAGCWWLLRRYSGQRPGEPGADETMGHVWDGDLREYNQPLPLWWMMLFYLTIFFGIAYIILYPALGNYKGVLGWTQTGQYENELQQARNRYSAIYDRLAELSFDELAADEQAMGIGHRLFVINCSVCHGSDARGAPTFPNLTDADWLYGGEPDAILTSILKGRAGMMPPMGATMDDQTIDNVVQYVLSLSGKDHDSAAAAAGKPMFATCSACHGLDGRGNQSLGAPNLTDDVWLYGSDAARIREGIVNGRANRMPAHEDLLGPERSRIMAAYIYQLSHERAP
ncbi:MAG: cytochrome-c oxidase, cbb3-type subunit III [Gammaproteobacteria bacterium]|nr:cytochrome-c oxidase, cbb3-type subunit III [Gammaproteobacteria bacterium]MDH3768133.1 cytochrome-c oxidase, cbb3-type subunit III [Gammaproteobacteria bacterium]